MIVDGIVTFPGGNHARPLMELIEDIQSLDRDGFNYRSHYDLDEYAWLKYGSIVELGSNVSYYYKLKELLGDSNDIHAMMACYAAKFGRLAVNHRELYEWVKGGEYGEDLALSSQQEPGESSVPVRKADL